MIPAVRFRGIIVLLAVAMLAMLSPTQAMAAAPTPKVAAHVDTEIVPAFHRGDPFQIAESISPLLHRLDESQLRAASKYSAEKGLPQLVKLLGDARLNLVESGDARQETRLKLSEAKIVMPRLKARIDEIVGRYDHHPIAREEFPASKDWAAYEQMFWDLHVLQNELAIAARVCDFSVTAASPHVRTFERNAKKRARKSNQQAANAASETSMPSWMADYKQIAAGIQQRTQELYHREIELRFYRMEDADATLADANAGKVDRLQAAFAMRFDSSELNEHFVRLNKMSRKAKEKADGNPDLVRNNEQEIAGLIERATRNAGDEIRKSSLLFLGMHYWARGRYGAGPQAWGLLKNEDAIKSEARMFPLLMPAELKPATDPLQESMQKRPQVERRHHYVWGVEDRPLRSEQTGFKRANTSTVQRKVDHDNAQTTTTQMSRFY